ncbi:MAG: hypothetical protein ACRCXY_11445 [Fusobacteriaceae bacterium]
MTSGSLGMKLQRKYARDFLIQHPILSQQTKLFNISKESYDLADNFFYGGFTQVHPKVLELANEEQ